MKKQIFITIALTFLLAFGVKADPVVTVTIDDVVKQPGTVLVPVFVDFSDAPGGGVGSIELTITFDNDVLTEFIGPQNEAIAPGDWVHPKGDVGNEFKINWSDYDNPSTLDGKLFDLEFEYAGGYSPLTFVGKNIAGKSEIGGESDAEVVTATFNDGSITQAPPIPIALWSMLIGFGLISLFTLKRSARNR